MIMSVFYNEKGEHNEKYVRMALRLIKGTLRSRLKDGDFDYPAKMKKVQILSGGNILASSFTSLSGEFQFRIKIRSGKYTLRAFFGDSYCDKTLELSSEINDDIIFVCNSQNL